MMRLVYLASHRIQYHVPLFQALARNCAFQAWFAHRQDAEAQGAAGYGVPFDWDVEFDRGFDWADLPNAATRPDVSRFQGVSCPDVDDWLQRFDPHVVVVGGWNLRVYWQALNACRRRGVAVVARTDSRPDPGESRLKRVGKAVVYPRMLRRFDHFAPAGLLSSAYLSRFGIPECRYTVVPHVVDAPRFAAEAERARRGGLSFAREAGLDPGTPIVGFVGRLLPWKRVDDLLRALAQSRVGPVQALVVGAGPERGRLERLAREVGVRAAFVGFVNQSGLPQAYAAMDAFVLPSDARETWGLVANEAIACGVPVVASSAAGCAVDLVRPGVTGERYPCGDVGALAAAVARVLAVGRPAYADALSNAADACGPATAADRLLLAARRARALHDGRERHG